jgi:hypothetical protein
VWGIQSGGVSSSIGFNLSLYLESRATPGISASTEVNEKSEVGMLKRLRELKIHNRLSKDNRPIISVIYVFQLYRKLREGRKSYANYVTVHEVIQVPKLLYHRHLTSFRTV